jgi:Ni,Fe-hydrogenase III large subunit
MKLAVKQIPIDTVARELEEWLAHEGRRIGFLTSVDGAQIVLLLLDPLQSAAELWECKVNNNSYTSLTLAFPQLHWFERLLWNHFGIVPKHHPRLKPIIVHEPYDEGFFPLRQVPFAASDEVLKHGPHEYMEVNGDGVWELPVGPIHAGVIEPGHFRFSCLGETILNLELKFGYVHRGVEKRITEVPWRRARFVAEAAASDTACANALAHAIAMESLADVEVPQAAQILRTIALEIERTAMHIIDIGGMMTDIGWVSMSATMGKLRGIALGLGQTLSGSRFLRAYIVPGGVAVTPSADQLAAIHKSLADLRHQVWPVIEMFRENQSATARMEGIGQVKPSLASEFGLVGVAGRACGISYDTRLHFPQGVHPQQAPALALQTGGDILARTQVRINELWESLTLIERLSATPISGSVRTQMPDKLPANSAAMGIVEAFRGELIHLCITDEKGSIKRYGIKDPSTNNWTAISIAVRDNLIADFPLCNKSLALSYSGTDL